MTSGCAWERCDQEATHQVYWVMKYGGVPLACGYGFERLCASHAERASRDVDIMCTCGSHGVRAVAVSELPYVKARRTYLETGLIADKDVMVDAVTLREPAGWDTFGSILAAPGSQPQRRKFGELRLADTIGFVPVWLAGLFVVFAAILAMVGLFSL